MRFIKNILTVPTLVGGEESLAILEALNSLFHHFSSRFPALKEQVSKQET